MVTSLNVAYLLSEKFIMSKLELIDRELGLYKKTNKYSSKWVVKARQAGMGKVVTVQIGNAKTITLSDAKKFAKPIISQLSQGQNPNENKRKVVKTQHESLILSKKDILLNREIIKYYERLKRIKILVFCTLSKFQI